MNPPKSIVHEKHKKHEHIVFFVPFVIFVDTVLFAVIT